MLQGETEETHKFYTSGWNHREMHHCIGKMQNSNQNIEFIFSNHLFGRNQWEDDDSTRKRERG